MQEASRCWVCGRSAEEIQSSLDAESQEEIEIKKQMAQVTWFRGKFMESAALWRKSIPREFRDMDFLFVTDNAGQFRTMDQLGEIIDAKKLMLDYLADASTKLRKGDGGSLGSVSLSSMDKGQRETIAKMLDLYERKWHRQFAQDNPLGFPAGFEGLKLADGLEFLINGGLLYYDVQAQLLEFARQIAISSKPKYGVGSVEVKGNPRVSLCNVCESLIKELRVPLADRPKAPERAEKPERPAAQALQTPEQRGQKAVAQVAKAVQVEAEPDLTVENASPEFVEVVKKIGPATKEAPKTRALHDHRLKEDWDEMLNQKAEAEG
jgi:hypothetical protein